MNKLIACACLLLCGNSIYSQPITNSAVLARLDLDNNEVAEVTFQVEASLHSEIPETWRVGMGLIPVHTSRILRRNRDRISFDNGDLIGPASLAVTNVHETPPFPPSFTYSLPFLIYSAVFLGEWYYQSLPNATFAAESEVLVGFRFGLSDGFHYGWLYFVREVADDHTAFKLVSFNFHPVPQESIKAGQSPPLPSIITSKIDGQIEFVWDPRWGNLVLESTTNLWSGGPWQALDHSTGGPVYFSEDEDVRFFRLRYP